MYFPYLRGRQNELIGIRDLVDKGLISKNIVPIVEPVKLSTTLINTMKKFTEKNSRLGIVINPKVGELQEDLEELGEEDEIYKEYKNILNNHNVIKVYLMNEDSEDEIYQFKKEEIESMIVCLDDINNLDLYKTCFSNVKPFHTLMKDDSSIRRLIRENRILLDDKFNKALRNIDYIDREDELFSLDHLYFKEDGYIGYSDYLIVGKKHEEGGFAPRAIAIHITYFDKDYNLRIRHFVSDSNEDISNPAGKFGEALSKLIYWMDKNDIKETLGLKCFRELYIEGRYPNLGVVKRLSIMHHIELVDKYLLNEI